MRIALMSVVAFGSVFFAASEADAQSPVSRTADLGPAPPAIHWERRGAATGRALIFLPALGFPGSSWADVYKSFEPDHPIYVVTFAGTNGVPPTKPPYLERMANDVHQLIRDEKLKDPVMVGHLLGADVALRVASSYPD